MVLVEIFSPVYDEEAGSTRHVWRANIKADENELSIAGDALVVAAGDLPVVDVLTGETITAADDPELWARNLPYAFRAGDIVAATLHDDAPADETPRSDDTTPRETPSIPVRSPAQRLAAGTC